MVAAIHDPDYINDNINFWKHIYGFSMTAMKEKIRDEVDIVHMPKAALASEPVAFCNLPLHTVKVEDLVFTKPFQVKIKEDIETLDGFLIYFDNYFATSRDQVIPADARAETWKDPKGSGVAFTTGPIGKETHWRQGLLLVDEDKNQEAKTGEVIAGEITYRKEKDNSRAYDLDIEWTQGEEKKKQTWFMR